MLNRMNPKGAPQPASKYSQAVEAAAGMRWLHISGQIGVTPEGKVVEGAEGQLEQAWRNILACLQEAGMEPKDLVKITVLLTRKEAIPLSRAVRDRMIPGVAPASTLMVLAGLASPDYLIEIEAIAAK